MHTYMWLKKTSQRNIFISQCSSKKPAKQIEQFMAAPSPATVDVCVAGVDDKCITGNIRIGRPVKIRAEITGKLLMRVFTKRMIIAIIRNLVLYNISP